MRIAGVDPGLSGAIAVIEEKRIVAIFDFPTVEIKKGNGKGRDYLIPAIADFLSAANIDEAVIEGVTANPTNGSIACFSLGRGLGILEGILAARGIRYSKVHPAKWKNKLLTGMAKGKGSSLVRVQQLYPLDSGFFTLKKHEGRAEAALLAHYGVLTQGLSGA